VSVHETAETVEVPASADAVFTMIEDVRRWPQLFTSLVHTSVEPAEPGSGATDVVRCWGVRGHAAVRAWSAQRWIDRAELTIDFDNTPPPPGVTAQRGRWTVTPTGPQSCTVTLGHDFTLAADADQAMAARIAEQFAAHSRSQLDELAAAATRGQEREELIVSWEETLTTSGATEDAWAVLYECGKWPERIPHVSRLDLTEPSPDVQFFDMYTATPDGRTHTSRSVRICLPHDLIVYKQVTTPPQLEAHTGHWRFTRLPDGTLEMGARHTVTIKRDAVSGLADGTVAGARAYAREMLGKNSMKNLLIAKKYAEEAASCVS
jgi:C7-C12 aromatase (ARO/CYC)